jgi:hypothetical protein
VLGSASATVTIKAKNEKDISKTHLLGQDQTEAGLARSLPPEAKWQKQKH